MQDQPAAESPPRRWAPGQAALIAAAVILVVLVVTTLLGQAGVLLESAAAAMSAAFLGVCGLVAGLIGAGERRKERWPGATMAYRVAMWCFFLAALHALKFHAAAEREASEFFEQVQRLKERQKAGDTAPQGEP